MTVDELIRQYALLPTTEGGFFRETYRAPATLPGTSRSLCTAIYFLLGRGQRSRLHRIDADELWHFYRGDPLCVVELVEHAPPRVTELSARHPQHLVQGGHLVSARCPLRTRPGAWSAAPSPLPSSSSAFELGNRQRAAGPVSPRRRAHLEAQLGPNTGQMLDLRQREASKCSSSSTVATKVAAVTGPRWAWGTASPSVGPFVDSSSTSASSFSTR
jgi:hypothetical protein